MVGKGVATVAQLFLELYLHIVGEREVEKALLKSGNSDYQGSNIVYVKFLVLTFRREPILENNRTSLVEYSHNALEHDRRLRFINDKMKIIIKQYPT